MRLLTVLFLTLPLLPACSPTTGKVLAVPDVADRKLPACTDKDMPSGFSMRGHQDCDDFNLSPQSAATCQAWRHMVGRKVTRCNLRVEYSTCYVKVRVSIEGRGIKTRVSAPVSHETMDAIHNTVSSGQVNLYCY